MLFARPPRLMFSRRLMHRRCESRIPSPTAPATGNRETLVRLRELKNLIAGFIVKNNCPDRNLQDDAVTIASCLIRPFAVSSALRGVFGIKAEMYERVVPLARLHDDVSTLAAITARGSAPRNKLLPPERHAAIPAVPGLDSNFRLIDKHEFAAHISARQQKSLVPKARLHGADDPARAPSDDGCSTLLRSVQPSRTCPSIPCSGT